MSVTTLPDLSPAELSRYSRHILLDQIGLEGQRRLAASRALVIGAGGLGSPAALYLAAAGVGTIGIADFDRVEEHNLQRQLLHDSRSVGRLKVESAAERLAQINPFVRVVPHADGVTVENAVKLFSEYDVILDGTDNFTTRYLNNDAAFFARKPLVYGSIFRFEGQVAVFDPARGGPCYRCLFPEPPPPGEIPNCAEAGVVGALCGVIGSLQAMEALKLLANFGEPLLGRLLTYDALSQRFNTISLPRDPDCPLCGVHPRIQTLQLENVSCQSPAPSSSMSDHSVPLEISVEETRQLLQNSPDTVALIDVRESHERAICRIEGAIHIPMRQIPEQLDELPRNKHLLIQCHHGGRSMRVTEFLRSRGFTDVSNVAGGIDAWALQIEPGMNRY